MGFESGEAVVKAMPSIISSAGNLASQFTGNEGASDAKEQAEALAREKELDAKETARWERQQAAKTAEEIREDKQRRKARARAMWGKSGVGMSGSAARVVDGMDSDMEQKIQDVRGEADQRARYALSIGNNQAMSIRNKAKESRQRSINPSAVGDSIIGLGKSLFNI